MEKKQRVLIVEDEKNIVDILRFNLRKEEFTTPKRPTTGEVGLALALQEAPRPDPAGPDAAQDERVRGVQAPAGPGEKHPGDHHHRPGGGKGQDPGPGFGGGRLHHQALLHPGADGPGKGQHPPGAMAPRPRPPALEGGAPLRPPGDPKGEATATKDRGGPGAHPREFELLAYLAAHAGRVFFRQELMERCGTTRAMWGTSGRWTWPSAACGKRWRTTPPSPNTSSPAGGGILLPTGAVTRQGRGGRTICAACTSNWC